MGYEFREIDYDLYNMHHKSPPTYFRSTSGFAFILLNLYLCISFDPVVTTPTEIDFSRSALLKWNFSVIDFWIWLLKKRSNFDFSWIQLKIIAIFRFQQNEWWKIEDPRRTPGQRAILVSRFKIVNYHDNPSEPHKLSEYLGSTRTIYTKLDV